MTTGESLAKLLCEMVKIPSESGNEKEYILYLKDRITRTLSAQCTIDSYGNLIARIPGKNCARKEPVFFAMHADTVSPGVGIEPTVREGVVSSSGHTILGADDKAGISEVLEAILTATMYPPLELVVSREEETGLTGAKNLDFGMIQSKTGFLLDTTALDSVVIGGPSHLLIDVEIKGKAAHAAHAEEGISAIKAASNAIAVIRDGRIDEETVANVGTIQGGTIRNGVPERVSIKAECRSLNHEKCVELGNTMKEVFEATARSLGAKAEVQLHLAYKATRIPKDSLAVKVACHAIESIGLVPKITTILGGTDASIYNTRGLETVVLGTGVRGQHTKGENIAVADMEKAVKMIHSIFCELCR
jgi:tripeptide aminopeptidase